MNGALLQIIPDACKPAPTQMLFGRPTYPFSCCNSLSRATMRAVLLLAVLVCASHAAGESLSFCPFSLFHSQSLDPSGTDVCQEHSSKLARSLHVHCVYSECTCCPPVAKFLLCVKPVWHKSCGMDVCHWEGARTAHLQHNSHNHASGSCQLRGSAAFGSSTKAPGYRPPLLPSRAAKCVLQCASYLLTLCPCHIAPAVPLLHPPQV